MYPCRRQKRRKCRLRETLPILLGANVALCDNRILFHDVTMMGVIFNVSSPTPLIKVKKIKMPPQSLPVPIPATSVQSDSITFRYCSPLALRILQLECHLCNDDRTRQTIFK